jgi:hypothetical protein
MTFDDFLPILEGDLASLTPCHRLLFSASCCARALPNLVAYARASNAIDPDAAMTALDEVWKFLKSEHDSPDTHVFKEACTEQLPPGTDPSPLATAAEEAIQMITLLLDQLTYAQPRLSREIASWAQATIDSYVQMGPLQIKDLKLIPNSALMQRELNKQTRDLDWLKAHRGLIPSRTSLPRLSNFFEICRALYYDARFTSIGPLSEIAWQRVKRSATNAPRQPGDLAARRRCCPWV